MLPPDPLGRWSRSKPDWPRGARPIGDVGLHPEIATGMPATVGTAYIPRNPTSSRATR